MGYLPVSQNIPHALPDLSGHSVQVWIPHQAVQVSQDLLRGHRFRTVHSDMPKELGLILRPVDVQVP